VREETYSTGATVAVEFFESGLRFMLLFLLAAAQDFEQGLGCLDLLYLEWNQESVAIVATQASLPWAEPQGRHLHTCSHFSFRLIELLHPLHHDLHVAQGAEALKQAPAGLLHRLPVGIGIEGINPSARERQRRSATRRS